MRTLFPLRTLRSMYAFGIAVFIGLYVFSMQQLGISNNHSQPLMVQHTVQQWVRHVTHKNIVLINPSTSNIKTSPLPLSHVTVTGNVPDAVVQQIAQHLGGIQGTNEELVVMNAVGAGGYTVSATVSLGNDAAESPSLWQSTVNQDIVQYFQGVFSKKSQVTSAEVYFTVGGQVIAGAGLGDQSYRSLTATASTTSSPMTNEIQQLPVVNQQGVNDSWFEEETSPS